MTVMTASEGAALTHYNVPCGEWAPGEPRLLAELFYQPLGLPNEI